MFLKCNAIAASVSKRVLDTPRTLYVQTHLHETATHLGYQGLI